MNDVVRMSLEEKQNVTTGISPSPNGCVGESGSAHGVGFPGLCLSDGPTGVRGTDFVSAFPAEMHIGASWNTDLAFEMDVHMGKEFGKKGSSCIFRVASPLISDQWQQMSLSPRSQALSDASCWEVAIGKDSQTTVRCNPSESKSSLTSSSIPVWTNECGHGAGLAKERDSLRQTSRRQRTRNISKTVNRYAYGRSVLQH